MEATVIIDRTHIHYVPVEAKPEQEWDVIEGRYRSQSAADAESARLNAARETWELPAPEPEEMSERERAVFRHITDPGEDNQTA